jgi:hypothetical protein
MVITKAQRECCDFGDLNLTNKTNKQFKQTTFLNRQVHVLKFDYKSSYDNLYYEIKLLEEAQTNIYLWM